MLSERDVLRFSRQILVREVGGAGQRKLQTATVVALGEGPGLQMAVDYLRAGGTIVNHSLPSDPLPTGGVVLRTAPGGDFSVAEAVVGQWWAMVRPAAACVPCWKSLSSQIGDGSAPFDDGVLTGALAALLVQRLVLGRHEMVGVHWNGDELHSLSPGSCAHYSAHQGTLSSVKNMK